MSPGPRPLKYPNHGWISKKSRKCQNPGKMGVFSGKNNTLFAKVNRSIYLLKYPHTLQGWLSCVKTRVLCVFTCFLHVFTTCKYMFKHCKTHVFYIVITCNYIHVITCVFNKTHMCEISTTHMKCVLLSHNNYMNPTCNCKPQCCVWCVMCVLSGISFNKKN